MVVVEEEEVEDKDNNKDQDKDKEKEKEKEKERENEEEEKKNEEEKEEEERVKENENERKEGEATGGQDAFAPSCSSASTPCLNTYPAMLGDNGLALRPDSSCGDYSQYCLSVGTLLMLKVMFLSNHYRGKQF